MAFSDPQSVTVATVAQSLARVSLPEGNFQGMFLKDDQTFRLSIGQSKTKRSRHVVRLSQRKIAPDPLASANNVEYEQHVTLTVDAPNVGFTNAEKKDLVVALAAWLTASTNANTVRLTAFES